MSTIAVKKVKLGDNADTSKNFLIEVPAVADGTLTIKRENGTAVLSVDATGKAVIPGVVGTVAQVGGIPTGQVVERGSNANGDYVRFADGTQICTRVVNVAWNAGTSGDSVTLNFPAAFSATPRVTATLLTGAPHLYDASIKTVSSTSFTVSAGGSAANSGDVGTHAIGRWF